MSEPAPVFDGPAVTIGHRLDVVADRTPDAPAFLAPTGDPLTHAGLARGRARWLAALRVVNIGRRDRVALVMNSGRDMAETLVAVLCAAVAAPLDPALTDRELGAYLAQLAPAAVLADTGSAARLRALVGASVPVLPADPGDPPRPAAEPPADSDDLALLLFTSGTTARPKIVQLTQRSLVAAAESIAVSLALGPEDRALNLMPLHHGHGITAGTLAPLLSGGSVLNTRAADPEEFAAAATAAAPTWYSAAPVLHDAVLTMLRLKPELAAVLRLRAIRSTSSPLPARLLTELEEAFGAPVVEAYALSEVPGHAATNPLHGPRKPGTVGRAGLTRIALLTPDGITTEPGVSGEILVRGPNVMGGYADLTDAGQPFQDGWLRTGDEGSLDADGYLTISGRVAEVISRGAEKISPAEVEAALLEHDEVREAAVFGVAHPSLGQEPAAVVVLVEGASVTEDDLVAFAADRLAPFKVPVRVDVLAELPRGVTGKVKRLQLSARPAPAKG